MALTTVHSGSYRTVITRTTSGENTSVASTITTDIDEKRVTSIRVSINVGENNSDSPFSEEQKKRVHNDIVTAITNAMSSGTNKGGI